MPLALVTGGGIRVGRAISLALGSAGFDVIVHANRSLVAAHDTVMELRGLGCAASVETADLSSAEAIAGLVEKLSSRQSGLDLLVNSAATYTQRRFEEISVSEARYVMSVNYIAPFLLIQGLLGPLRKNSGAVVNITDVAISRPYSATHQHSHYTASKAALQQLTRSLAVELAPAIRVNAVAPGAVAISADTTDSQRTALLTRLPLAREGRPDDVAEAVLFLANATYVTGHTIHVDGGLNVS